MVIIFLLTINSILLIISQELTEEQKKYGKKHLNQKKK